jgi:antitoxin component YwqK of YwqJK toxin-antitoxin module
MNKLSIKLGFTLIFLVSLFLNINVSFAQQNKVIENGYNKFYYPDKTLSAEGLMKDGKPTGYWKSYYPNSKLKAEGNRKGDLLDSIWRFYDEKGILTEIIDYKNGLRSGYNIKYKQVKDSLGTKNVLISKELFIEGKLNGKSIYYNDSGKFDHTCEYERGYKNGLERYFDENGVVNLILKYSFNNLIDNEYINRKDKLGRKQGVWEEFFDNEKIKTFSVYSNDTLNGYYREYDTFGNITKSLYFKKGVTLETSKSDSSNIEKEIRKTYYKNGNIKSIGTYINDVKIGKHILYDSTGEIENSIEYDVHGIASAEGYTDSRGYKQKEWNYLFPDSKIKASGIYIDNKRVGEWNFLFPNGSKEQIGLYDNNGRPSGNWKWFYSDKKIRREGKFINGLEEGFFYELSPDGDTLTSGNYVQGLKSGLWKINVNDHLEIGIYLYGKKSGIWKYYYTNNILEFQGNFIEGLEDGNHKYFYPNKNLKVSSYYSGGVKSKKWKYFDEEGNIISIVEFKNGEKYKIDGEKIKD